MSAASPKVADVSVIMPVYNGAKTIQRALDSVFAQSVIPREVIAIDDASTDETRAILETYKSRGLITITADHNRGAGAARNRGVAAARSGYLAFIDADDEWHSHKLERQFATLNAEPAIQASCSGYQLVAPNRSDTVSYHEMPLEIGVDEFAGGCSVSPGSTLIVSRACFDAVGPFDPTLRRYEDWDWLLRYAAKHRLRLEREILATIYDDRAGHGLTLLSLRALARKHRAAGTFSSASARLKFESHLLLERGAISHRTGRHLKAALWATAAVAVYPSRIATIRTNVSRALSSFGRRRRTQESEAFAAQNTGESAKLRSKIWAL